MQCIGATKPMQWYGWKSDGWKSERMHVATGASSQVTQKAGRCQKRQICFIEKCLDPHVLLRFRRKSHELETALAPCGLPNTR